MFIQRYPFFPSTISPSLLWTKDDPPPASSSYFLIVSSPSSVLVICPWGLHIFSPAQEMVCFGSCSVLYSIHDLLKTVFSSQLLYVEELHLSCSRDGRLWFSMEYVLLKYTVKKRFASFPSPAGISLPNSPWAGIMTS
jgi:hypothetical protein